MNPSVSILIPAHNAAAWIEQTLESAFAQTYPACEIVVVDDGSSDDTFDRAQNASKGRFDQIQVITQRGAGASAARNHAFRLSRGDYIQYLDADDILEPNKIASQIDQLRSAPTTVMASGRWERFRQSVGDHSRHKEAVDQARSGVEFLQLHYETRSMMQPNAWLTPRALIEAAGPWNEELTLNDDGEFFARVMLRSSGIRHIPASICYYRSGDPRSLSRRRDPRALQSLFRSVELTTSHLLTADDSPRSRAAAVRAWRWSAYELYPEAISLATRCRAEAAKLGGPDSPLGGPRWVQRLAALTGWSFARRIQQMRNRLT